jgi:hypothetical protein
MTTRRDTPSSAVTLEDRVLIRELYDRFFAAWNAGDGETMKACFTPAGQSVKHDGSIATPADLAALAGVWQSDPVARTRQHHVTNVVVEPHVEGRDECRSVRTYFLVTEVTNPPAIDIRWSCRTADEVQRVDGQWRFLRCRTLLNHPATA